MNKDNFWITRSENLSGCRFLAFTLADGLLENEKHDPLLMTY